MKTIKFMVTMLSLSVMYQLAAAQAPCSGNKVHMAKGINGLVRCGCRCQKKCVDLADTATYRANGWYFGNECWGNCCWIRLDEQNSSTETSLTEIYPNPASGSATIFFFLSQSQKVSFKLFDMTGRLIATLAEEIFEGGENEFIWNASGTTAGVYFLRMETGSYSAIKRISVIK